jgi:hypothetical protein
MPSITERLIHITLKVQRAKLHIASLEREIRAFLDTKPYEVGTKRDPQTRRLIYYVTKVDPVPVVLALIAGDAVQNLMCALDHLAYQLVGSDTGDKPPNPNWIYFPIADDAARYNAKKARKMEGAAQETLDAVDALKPYKGGNDSLWVLYRLNNVEKHRLLLTVGSKATSFNVLRDAARNVPPGEVWKRARPLLEQLADQGLFLQLKDTGFPLKAGFELYIDRVDAEPDPKQEFRFDVALNEAGIIESESLLTALQQLTTVVEGVITALAPRLRDTP